ncbi:MAG: M23 family metallopeptidase [Rhizobiaceae bacterium]
MALFFATSAAALAQKGPDFDLPVKCGVEQPCFLQNLMDMDSGPGFRDPFCNAATYDGHKGTDIRLRNYRELRATGQVYAMADGVVTAMRNNMADRLMETAQDQARIRGRECGNGLVIDYGMINGARYTSQLCHLARGSIKLRVGDRIKRGQQIGRIGLSGATEFPHLHFSVSRNGQLIDPVTGSLSDRACSDGKLKNTLFSASALKPLVETGFKLLLEDGFADGPVNGTKILKSQIKRPGANTPFVYFAKFINLKKGDFLRLSIEGPAGLLTSRQTEPLDRNKASYTAFIGKRNRPPSGTYRGNVELLRGGNVISTHTSKPFRF